MWMDERKTVRGYTKSEGIITSNTNFDLSEDKIFRKQDMERPALPTPFRQLTFNPLPPLTLQRISPIHASFPLHTHPSNNIRPNLFLRLLGRMGRHPSFSCTSVDASHSPLNFSTPLSHRETVDAYTLIPRRSISPPIPLHVARLLDKLRSQW
jgi:hypothetical protein